MQSYPLRKPANYTNDSVTVTESDMMHAVTLAWRSYMTDNIYLQSLKISGNNKNANTKIYNTLKKEFVNPLSNTAVDFTYMSPEIVLLLKGLVNVGMYSMDLNLHSDLPNISKTFSLISDNGSLTFQYLLIHALAESLHGNVVRLDSSAFIFIDRFVKTYMNEKYNISSTGNTPLHLVVKSIINIANESNRTFPLLVALPLDEPVPVIELETTFKPLQGKLLNASSAIEISDWLRLEGKETTRSLSHSVNTHSVWNSALSSQFLYEELLKNKPQSKLFIVGVSIDTVQSESDNANPTNDERQFSGSTNIYRGTSESASSTMDNKYGLNVLEEGIENKSIDTLRMFPIVHSQMFRYVRNVNGTMEWQPVPPTEPGQMDSTISQIIGSMSPIDFQKFIADPKNRIMLKVRHILIS
jgi:hypothetical protein